MAYENKNELIWTLECLNKDLYTSLGYKKYMKTIMDAEEDTQEIVKKTKLPFTSEEVLIFFDHVISQKESDNESISDSKKIITICKVADYLNYEPYNNKEDYRNYDEFMVMKCDDYCSKIFCFIEILVNKKIEFLEWVSIQTFYEEYEKIFGHFKIPKKKKLEYKETHEERMKELIGESKVKLEGKYLENMRKRLLELETGGILKNNVTEEVIKEMLGKRLEFDEFFN